MFLFSDAFLPDPLSHPIGYTLLDIISYSDYVKMWKHC